MKICEVPQSLHFIFMFAYIMCDLKLQIFIEFSFGWEWLFCFGFISPGLQRGVRKTFRHPFKLGLVSPHLVRFGLIWSASEGGG